MIQSILMIFIGGLSAMLGLFSWIRRDTDLENTKIDMTVNATIQSCDSVLSASELLPDSVMKAKMNKESKKKKKRNDLYNHQLRESRRGKKNLRCRAAKQKHMKGELSLIMTTGNQSPRKRSLKMFMLGGRNETLRSSASDAEEVARIMDLYNSNDYEALYQKSVKMSIQKPNNNEDEEVFENEYGSILDFSEEYTLKNAHDWARLSGVRPLPRAVDKLKRLGDFESPVFDFTPICKPKSWASHSSIFSPTYSSGPRTKIAAETKTFKDVAFTWNDTPESTASQYFSPLQKSVDENEAPSSITQLKIAENILSHKKKISFSPLSSAKKIASVLKEANCLSPIMFKSKEDRSFIF